MHGFSLTTSVPQQQAIVFILLSLFHQMHWLVTLVALAIAVPAYGQHQQHTFAVHPNTNLHGRFLHITDIHVRVVACCLLLSPTH